MSGSRVFYRETQIQEYLFFPQSNWTTRVRIAAETMLDLTSQKWVEDDSEYGEDSFVLFFLAGNCINVSILQPYCHGAPF